MGSPSYLVVWFSATAGQNGENLGSDEEEIVLVVYLLLDIANAKVVGLQHHYVKPRTADISDSILTEECKQDTGLQEEQIKNAQPLESVLDEFEKFMRSKGMHPEHAGRPFNFCTDGGLHFRQCLHPETCNKSIGLPPYYSSYFDMRKEFAKFYKCQKVESIKEMLDYLGIAGDNTVEFGSRQCQDMASICIRLASDGHEFTTPDMINDRLSPGICRREDDVDDETVVRARGLPWQASDQDIARFFKGLNIAKGGVALCLSSQGRRNGEAVIKLESEEHRNLALKRHKHHIGQRYIEVYRATGKDFINVAGGANEDAHMFLQKGNDIIVRMRGLPFTATQKEVLEFFQRADIPPRVMNGEDGILFVKYHDGRATGDAFVQFASEEDATRALGLHREVIGSRYIELFKSTTAEVQQVLNRSLDPSIKPPGEMSHNNNNPQQPLLTQMPIVPQQLITQGCTRDCIRLRGLPIEAQVTDILSFLGDFSKTIVYQGVHMVYNAQGQPAGEAFIQLDSENAASMAQVSKNGKYIMFGGKKKFIEVLQVSGEDMHIVLTGGIPSAQPVVQQPRHSVMSLAPALQYMPRAVNPLGGAAYMPQALAGATYPISPMAASPLQPSAQFQVSMGGPPQAHMASPASHMSGPGSPTAAMTASLPGALAQVAATPQNAAARMAAAAAGHAGVPSYYPQMQQVPQMVYFYPSPPVSPQNYYAAAPTAAAAGAQPSMLMRGLPYNTSVTPENIQIQRTADGRASGDAIVSFINRGEAERAVAEKNRNVLGHKQVDLYMAA